jgi:predicted nucleotidyltransferase
VRASRSGESALLLLDVVEALADNGFDYAVVGALAAAIHGAVRASLDADAVLSADPREAARIKSLLEGQGLQVELSRGDAGDPIAALLRVCDVHGNRVDLLLGLRGMRPEVFVRSVPIDFQGGKVMFAGREDFIAMKAYAGSPLDMRDAVCAIEAAGLSLDNDLLRRIAAGYGHEASATVEKLLEESRR